MYVKTALVTGGSKRIGAIWVNHLAQKGWNVIIHCNSSTQDAIELKNQLSKKFSKQKFDVLEYNLKNIGNIEEIFTQWVRKNQIHSIELLINNASIFSPSSLANTDAETLEKHFYINFFAPLLLSKAYYNFCHDTNNRLIINILDSRIVSQKSTHAAYSLSKKSLLNLTEMSALEFAPYVRVNGIALGAILPPAQFDEHYIQELVQDYPMKSAPQKSLLTQTLDLFIDNQTLTGQVIHCNSGEQLNM